jgi:hypothetical protein
MAGRLLASGDPVADHGMGPSSVGVLCGGSWLEAIFCRRGLRAIVAQGRLPLGSAASGHGSGASSAGGHCERTWLSGVFCRWIPRGGQPEGVSPWRGGAAEEGVGPRGLGRGRGGRGGRVRIGDVNGRPGKGWTVVRRLRGPSEGGRGGCPAVRGDGAGSGGPMSAGLSPPSGVGTDSSVWDSPALSVGLVVSAVGGVGHLPSLRLVLARPTGSAMRNQWGTGARGQGVQRLGASRTGVRVLMGPRGSSPAGHRPWRAHHRWLFGLHPRRSGATPA